MSPADQPLYTLLTTPAPTTITDVITRMTALTGIIGRAILAAA